MIRLIGWVAVLFFTVSSEAAGEPCDPWAAKITSMQGVVEIRKHSSQKWQLAKLNDSLCVSDSVRTASRSRATLLVQEETFVVLKERSTVRFSDDQQSEKNLFSKVLNLFSGEAYFRSRRPRELGIETPFVNAMHDGTEFLVKVNQDSTQVVVFDGVVKVSNILGQVSVSVGQSAMTVKDQAPVLGPRIELRDAVQWTLYYPPVIDYTTASQNSSPSILKPVLDRFQNNDLAGAFEQLDSVGKAERNADYHILYASLLLTVGQVEQAQQSLNLAQQESQKNANVLALRSMIALAKSDQQQALTLAEQAQQISPQASAPKIALSYVYQSLFDIDKALNSSTQAVQADPDNGLAWARVSEMELATGNVDASMQAASKAQTLNPQLAKTNTVLGFARLASLDLSDAEQSFRTAIKRDPADPLARLGLGLAKMRQGHIKSGTKEMEAAANLDPDNALIRSYLGKAYYEQRRGSIASTEYAIAKKLDPKDPTPWFYDAIYKQTVNRPVEALHDMQKAIELNDNRAVFRSSLLLDQDLASRSAALGRIYNDLGFQQRGLREGWKSVNADPANYSSHRLLADNYAALPRHEIARVSELLRSQLLQPINLTPVQPQLAESNLLILDRLGPQSSSFNEFNPMFARNSLAFQASGVYGNNNTWGDEVTQSGLWNQFSYSLGQFHYESDGFQENRDLKTDIYNVFTQYAITPKLNIQAEYRHRETSQGDLVVNFDPTDYMPNEQSKRRRNTVRFGAHYAQSPKSDFIMSLIYADRDERINQFLQPPDPQIQRDTDAKGYQGEAQYIFRHDWINAVLGGGVSKLDVDDLIGLNFPFPCPLPSCEIPQSFDTEHANAYLYTNVKFPQTVSWTLGLSYDDFDSTSLDLSRVHPKLGMQWDITDWARFRLAYFRTIKRPIPVDQTIEPTQVSGFNQFFDDVNGTETERYGVGLDTQLTDQLSAGLEYSRRNLDVPSSGPEGLVVSDRQEELYATYFYWTPHRNWAVSFEPVYEIFRRSANAPSIQGRALPKVKTVIVPLKLKYFHPTGFFAQFGSSYINQKVDLAANSSFTSNSDDAFLFDAAIGYRLPKRLGIISLEARNLTDEHFHYQDLNTQRAGVSVTPRIVPDRTIFVRATFSFN
ncbi:MAG: TonB-dependent receptor [Methylococcales bacterium]